jgi:hypothetical protein
MIACGKKATGKNYGNSGKKNKIDDLTNPIGKCFHHQRHNGKNDGIKGNLF